MAQGFSGSYAINGVKILQPTNGQWAGLEMLGYDGNGRPMYPALGAFELSWGLVTTSDLKQLIDYFNYSNVSGTVVFDLPRWGDADYKFYSYSGTQISRPQIGEYFSGYVTNVKMTVSNIRP